MEGYQELHWKTTWEREQEVRHKTPYAPKQLPVSTQGSSTNPNPEPTGTRPRTAGHIVSFGDNCSRATGQFWRFGNSGGSVRRGSPVLYSNEMLVVGSKTIPYLQDAINLWRQPLTAPNWPLAAVLKQPEMPVGPHGSWNLVLVDTFTQRLITAFQHFWSESSYINSTDIYWAPTMNYTLWDI